MSDGEDDVEADLNSRDAENTGKKSSKRGSRASRQQESGTPQSGDDSESKHVRGTQPSFWKKAVTFLATFPWVTMSAWLITASCCIYVWAAWPNDAINSMVNSESHTFWLSMKDAFIVLFFTVDTWVLFQAMFYSPYFATCMKCCRKDNCLCMKRFASWISYVVYLFTYVVAICLFLSAVMLCSATVVMGIAVYSTDTAGFNGALQSAINENSGFMWGTRFNNGADGPAGIALPGDMTATTFLSSMDSCLTAFFVMAVGHMTLMVAARDSYVLSVINAENAMDAYMVQRLTNAKNELETRQLNTGGLARI